MEFIDLKTPYELHQSAIQQRIDTVLKHGKFILGPEVGELEEKLANYVGSRHCIAVSSGTDALLMAMMALEIRPGDEVITSPYSFFATAETIALLGAKPVFVDIHPGTYNLDADKLEDAITHATRAIMPVSLYGQCPDLEAINRIADRHGVPVIEDGAQSFGATHRGRRSCSLTTIGCTSFFPSKPLGCFGDAGACFTEDDRLAQRLRRLRVHGQERRYHHVSLGLNGRMDTIQAAILLAKLEIFPDETEKRARIGADYSSALQDCVTVPYIQDGNVSVYAQYTIEVDNRDELSGILLDRNIPTAVHYPLAIHQQPAFSYLNVEQTALPVAARAAERVLSLPMHPYLSQNDQRLVIDTVREAVTATSQN